MLGLNLNHVSKRDPRWRYDMTRSQATTVVTWWHGFKIQQNNVVVWHVTDRKVFGDKATQITCYRWIHKFIIHNDIINKYPPFCTCVFTQHACDFMCFYTAYVGIKIILGSPISCIKCILIFVGYIIYFPRLYFQSTIPHFRYTLDTTRPAKLANIWQTTTFNEFSSIDILLFLSKFHKSLFPRNAINNKRGSV